MESYFSVEVIHNLRYGFKDTINPLQLFIFTKVIHYSRPPLWVGYFIYFKFTCVSSIVYKCYIFSSVKETNLLINKGMCVLLFDVFLNIYYWEKLTFSKLVGKFLRKKIWRNALALKSKKVQGIFRKMFILALLSSAVFCLQNRVSDFF